MTELKPDSKALKGFFSGQLFMDYSKVEDR